MSKSGYEVGKVVTFGSYGDGVPEDEQAFKTGDVLTLTEISEEDSVEGNRCFLAKRNGDEIEGYVLESELGGVKKEENVPAAKAPAKPKAAKKAAQKKAPAKAKDTKPAPAAKKTKATAKPKAEKKVEPKKATAAAPAEESTAVDTTEASGAPPEHTVIEHAASVAKLVKEGGNACLKAAKALAGQLRSAFYDLGGLLLEIKNQAYFEVLKGEDGARFTGRPGFEEYVRQELGIEYRVAQHFINVYQVTREAGIPEAQVKALKYTKIVQLLGLIRKGAITKDTWGDWADKVKNLKGEAFKEAVSQAEVAAGVTRTGRGPTANQVRMTFVFFDDRAKVIEKAIDEALEALPPVEDGGTPHTKSEAIDLIVSEWLASRAQG